MTKIIKISKLTQLVNKPTRVTHRVYFPGALDPGQFSRFNNPGIFLHIPGNSGMKLSTKIGGKFDCRMAVHLWLSIYCDRRELLPIRKMSGHPLGRFYHYGKGKNVRTADRPAGRPARFNFSLTYRLLLKLENSEPTIGNINQNTIRLTNKLKSATYD